MKIKISAIEYYLPENIEDNEFLQNENPDWDMQKVSSKTGVFERHIAKENETALDLSVKACEKLFEYYDKNKIDGIIYCTQSPDFIMPSNAFLIHKHFNFKRDILAFDFNLACSGYIYGLIIAGSLIETGVAKNILLINADTYSKYINKKDRATRTLFGDGASVTMIEKSNDSSKIIGSKLASSGKDYEVFYVPCGGLKLPKNESTSAPIPDSNDNIRTQENIYMNGYSVWKFIQSTVPKQINELISNNNLTDNDINMYIFHQASKMTLESLIKSLNISMEKTFINIGNVGNLVSASIPVCLKDSITQGKIKRGDTVLLSGFGVGLSWGSLILVY